MYRRIGFDAKQKVSGDHSQIKQHSFLFAGCMTVEGIPDRD